MGQSAAPVPGDDVLPAPDVVMDRTLHLQASPDLVWPWLVQLGKGRAGWYMPRSVERFVPPARRATRQVRPELQHLTVGDRIPDWGPGEPEFELLELSAPHHLVYWSQRARRPRRGRPQPPMRLTWSLLLNPVGDSATILRSRLRLVLGHPPGPLVRYVGGGFDRLTIGLLGRGLNERLRP